MTRDRIPALDSWMAQQPRELNVEVQARLRRGMRLDTICILSTSPLESKFTDLPQSVIEDLQAMMTEKLSGLEPGDALELTVKRKAGVVTQTVTTDFTRARAAQDAAIEDERASRSPTPFGERLAARIVEKLTGGAEIGTQYDPRDGGAIGFWRNQDGTFAHGDMNVDQPIRRARATYPDAAAFTAWLAAESERTLFDDGFGITREELERSVNAGAIR